MDDQLLFYLFSLKEILLISSLIEFCFNILTDNHNLIYLILLTIGIFGITTYRKKCIWIYVLNILFNIYGTLFLNIFSVISILSLVYNFMILYVIYEFYETLDEISDKEIEELRKN